MDIDVDIFVYVATIVLKSDSSCRICVIAASTRHNKNINVILRLSFTGNCANIVWDTGKKKMSQVIQIQ